MEIWVHPIKEENKQTKKQPPRFFWSFGIDGFCWSKRFFCTRNIYYLRLTQDLIDLSVPVERGSIWSNYKRPFPAGWSPLNDGDCKGIPPCKSHLIQVYWDVDST